MPTLTEIPPELIASILRNLDNPRSLASTLLTCRYIHSAFKQTPGITAAALCRHVTPALLPYAVVALEASRLPCPHDRSSVLELLSKLYDKPSVFEDHLPSMPLNLLFQMERNHALVQAFATEFATGAWGLLREGDDSLPAAAVLSPSEQLRFYRAFYRVDIFYHIFRGHGFIGNFGDDMYPYFFLRHLPWENEQIGCVHDFLETRLDKASRDVVAHDVFFGELSISYLDSGMVNENRQTWLSGGLRFLHRLASEDSYDAKKKLLDADLNPDLGKGSCNLPYALEEVLQHYARDDAVVGEATKEELLSAIPQQPRNEDTDQGPYECWRYGHEGLPITATLMLINNDWLRDRAYVFWDHERVESQHLMDRFESSVSLSGHSRPMPSEADYDEMTHSFDERSKIWQQGGLGYWSQGDTSRIVWPSRD